jgi:hypothetical protein
VQDSEGRMSETPPPRRLELKRRSATGGVLVLGGGFAGGYVARGLGERGATIVSPDNSLTFSPLLPEAASGTLELRHVAVPLRMMCPHADLVLGRAAAHDPEARKVTVSTDSGERVAIGYEQLVIALGAVPRTFPIPGLLEHAVGAKTIADAIYLRDRVLRQLEAASIESDADRRRGQLTCVFVGGGYAGVGTLAELHDFAQDALRYFPTLRGVEQRWLLLDAAPRVRHRGADPRGYRRPHRDERRAGRARPRRVDRRHGACLRDARLDRRRPSEPDPSAAASPARRARTGRGRRAPTCERAAAGLGTR